MEKKNKKKKKQNEVQEGQEAVKKEKKEIKISVVLPLILVLAVVGSVIGTIVTTKFILPPPTVQIASEKDTGPGKIEEDQVILPLEEFLVNLAKQDETSAQEYIRVTISLLVDDAEDQADVEKNMALVRDSVVNTLRQKKSSDILGSQEGLDNLKAELKETINTNYGKEIVLDVFVTDAVIQ